MRSGSVAARYQQALCSSDDARASDDSDRCFIVFFPLSSLSTVLSRPIHHAPTATRGPRAVYLGTPCATWYSQDQPCPETTADEGYHREAPDSIENLLAALPEPGSGRANRLPLLLALDAPGFGRPSEGDRCARKCHSTDDQVPRRQSAASSGGQSQYLGESGEHLA